MRNHLGFLALAVCVTGSIADAKPRHHHGKKHKKVVPLAFAPETSDDGIDATDEVEIDMPPVRLHRHAAAHHARDWSVAIGPYLWASSVDANVSLGSASVNTGVDFLQTAKHAKYGVELLGDVRYGKVSLSGDFMYGVVGLTGGTSLGPLMVTVNGTASSLLVDGFAGYTLAGDEHSVVSIEARGGVRYQRTDVSAAVDVGDSPVAQPALSDAGRDFLAGARVYVRPASWFYVSGAGDFGVFGTSNRTWSASADASARLGSRVVLSLGWRTLTIESPNVSMVMHGPRAALQLVF